MEPISARDALRTTWRLCLGQDWTGWDPYDGLMTRRFPFTLLRASRLTRLGLIQIVKRSRFNLRPLLGIPPLRNSKALALGLESAVLLADVPEFAEEARREVERLVVSLERGAVPTRNGCGWGYPFDWQARSFWAPRNTPTVVCTGFVARALDSARLRFRSEPAIAGPAAALLERASRFVRMDLNRIAQDPGFCWSYSPLDHSQVVNATLLGAETVMRSASASGCAHEAAEALPTVAWALSLERSDGGWAYGSARHHRWEDGFHTGFNILSLHYVRELMSKVGEPDAFDLPEKIDRALAHYRHYFFGDDGRPWYYRNTPGPADAHAAAVAVITLLRVGRDEESRALARRVLDWVLQRMWFADGERFAYQLRPSGLVTVPFLRWSDAWMLLALAEHVRRERPAET